MKLLAILSLVISISAANAQSRPVPTPPAPTNLVKSFRFAFESRGLMTTKSFTNNPNPVYSFNYSAMKAADLSISIYSDISKLYYGSPDGFTSSISITEEQKNNPIFEMLESCHRDSILSPAASPNVSWFSMIIDFKNPVTMAIPPKNLKLDFSNPDILANIQSITCTR
jgi:hypothetical protein